MSDQFTYLDYNPFNLKNEVVRYVGNPQMIKIKHQGVFGFYYTCVDSKSFGKARFIIVSVPYDANPIGTKEYLSKLDWTMIQTRTLEPKDVPLPVDLIPQHSYNPSLGNETLKEVPITFKDRNGIICNYVSSDEHRLNITVIFPDQFMRHANNSNLWMAFESYNSVISEQ